MVESNLTEAFPGGDNKEGQVADVCQYGVGQKTVRRARAMATDNPYDSPKNVTVATAFSPAPLLWSVVAVFGAAFSGGLIGLGIGAALGTFVPGYYRSVFSRGNDPNFDPIAVGIGQGLTQGVVFGGVIGLLLVAMFYWYRSRSLRVASDQSAPPSDRPKSGSVLKYDRPVEPVAEADWEVSG
jgi:hypothetical protein